MIRSRYLLVLLPVFSVFLSVAAAAATIFIHVQGDSNSEGILPGSSCDLGSHLCSARIAERPWPLVMEQVLLENGFDVMVSNHTESDRKLAGRSALECGSTDFAEKDGRLAMWHIVKSMWVQDKGEPSENVILLLNLGSNDLQPEGVSEIQARNILITHIASILTSPLLDYPLLRQLNSYEQDIAFEFLHTLRQSTYEDEETPNLPPQTTNFILKNKVIVRGLFSLLEWQIFVIPPVRITGHPYGSFQSSDVSLHWPSIVKEAVEFFDSPHVIAVKNAQSFATPHVEECGGFVHFDETDHRVFGERMASFLTPYLEKLEPNEL